MAKKKVDTAELINITTREIKQQNRFATLSDTGDIYTWRGDIWVNSGEIKIKEMAELAMENASKFTVAEIIDKIRRQTYISRDTFNGNLDFLNVQNCVLDLKTGKTEEHSPDFYQTIQLPVKYDPKATCPVIDKFIKEVMADYAPLFYEMLAYCLISDYRFKKFFILLGEANTGKTTTVDLMYRFLGKQNTSELTLQNLADNRFSLANLYNRLANICDDLPKVEMKDVGRIKELTGNSPIYAEVKFVQKGISFTNRSKLIFTCNKIPRTQGSDDAFYSRLIIIPFRYRPDEPDNDMISKLTAEKEMSGLLNKVLAARRKLYQQNGFSIEQSVDEVEYMYCLGSLDTVTIYAHNRLEPDMICKTLKEDIYADYQQYCEANKYPHKEENAFHRKLQELGFNETTRIIVGDERKWAYMGIKIKGLDG